jgi:hypothetical protein
MVKHLENRLNTEGTFRDEDIAEIIIRLDDIDKVLNTTVGKRQPFHSVMTKTGEIDFETLDSFEDNFTRLRTAFTEEKSEAVRFRREIPKIQRRLISIGEDVKSYCKVSLNKSDHLLTSFETVKQVAEDNIITSENDREVLQSLVEQVHLNTDNDAKMSKKIEIIEILVTNLISHIHDTYFVSSCRSFMGKADDGIYNLGHRFQVYCDQSTDGGGWVVFQRRLNGETDFYRNWTEYKNGFGDLNGEYWLGNKYLSLLTSDGGHELRIEIEDFEGNSAYAKYSKFKIHPEEDNFKLEVSGFSGTAGESLYYHSGNMFSTYDHDTSLSNCAKKNHGAWWYGSCQLSNLNGQYYNQPGERGVTGITWLYWKNDYYSLKKVEMKFR